LSEGGLAVAVAEMAFAGGLGAELTGVAATAPKAELEVLLFAESLTRFVIEVAPLHVKAMRECFGAEVPLFALGRTCSKPHLRIAGPNDEWAISAALKNLKEAWQRPLRW
jgi:phosphoribosylformylglycinamidine synthase